MFLVLVLALCWFAMVGLGPKFHEVFSRNEAPDDLAELLEDREMIKEAPCDTCDGVGAGQVDGELMTCPACHGTGVISTDHL